MSAKQRELEPEAEAPPEGSSMEGDASPGENRPKGTVYSSELPPEAFKSGDLFSEEE